jgi:hypothetical protein
MNGIVFAGDSFTWGQGLYYYSKLPGLKIPKTGHYLDTYVTPSHRRFKETKRFARLVANKFETFELVKSGNGGSDYESLEFIDDIFKKDGYKYEDISYVIFQTTHFMRNAFEMEIDGESKELYFNNSIMKMQNMHDFFIKWINKNNYTLEDYEKLHIKQIFDKIKNKFIELESNGVKCKIMCWTSEYIDLIKNDEYMFDKFIPIFYDNKNIDCFETFMEDYPEMMIKTDPYFKNTIGDGHLSLNAHKIIANNIINKIEEYEQSTIHSV